MKIYLHIDPKTTIDRAVIRDEKRYGNASTVKERYEKKYLPGQELHRKLHDPIAVSDIMIDNNDWQNPKITKNNYQTGDDIYSILHSLNIPFVEYTHPPLHTAEEAIPYSKHIKGGKSKNLFLRNRKGNHHYLVIIEHTKMIDLKKLTQTLNETPLSFASPERLMKYLDITPGSVTPLGLINDINKEVQVIIDDDLLLHEYLSYHPNINTATLELRKDDFVKFLQWSGQKMYSIDLSTYQVK